MPSGFPSSWACSGSVSSDSTTSMPEGESQPPFPPLCPLESSSLSPGRPLILAGDRLCGEPMLYSAPRPEYRNRTRTATKWRARGRAALSVGCCAPATQCTEPAGTPTSRGSSLECRLPGHTAATEAVRGRMYRRIKRWRQTSQPSLALLAPWTATAAEPAVKGRDRERRTDGTRRRLESV